MKSKPGLLSLLAAVVMVGCSRGPASPPPEVARALRVTPILIQQQQAYEETATGIFLALADFEEKAQAAAFGVQPAASGTCRMISTQSRTGAGALEATLRDGGELVMDLGGPRNFANYTVLSLALLSPSLRDDLVIRLRSADGEWSSHRTIIRPGWNNVLVDIRHTADAQGFDPRAVRRLSVSLADCQGEATLVLDDVMLIDNTRQLQGGPGGIVINKRGLDYSLTLPQWDEPVEFTLCPDGLWRMGARQPTVQLAAAGMPAGDAEQLEPMGGRRVGQVELLEVNRTRVRLANVWYFPARAGEWASLSVRQIRWEHTFYPDGRWITSMELNNSGGGSIEGVAIRWPDNVALAGQGATNELLEASFRGPIGRWCWMQARGSRAGELLADYMEPPIVSVDGKALDAKSFEPREGCYLVHARSTPCRLSVQPSAAAACRPVVRLWGPWAGEVAASSEGLPLRDISTLSDGSVLIVLPMQLQRATAVEVIGAPRRGG
jgi:hypothetical protein